MTNEHVRFPHPKATHTSTSTKSATSPLNRRFTRQRLPHSNPPLPQAYNNPTDTRVFHPPNHRPPKHSTPSPIAPCGTPLPRLQIFLTRLILTHSHTPRSFSGRWIFGEATNVMRTRKVKTKIGLMAVWMPRMQVYIGIAGSGTRQMSSEGIAEVGKSPVIAVGRNCRVGSPVEALEDCKVFVRGTLEEVGVWDGYGLRLLESPRLNAWPP